MTSPCRPPVETASTAGSRHQAGKAFAVKKLNPAVGADAVGALPEDSRALREPGRRMRSHLLDVAVDLFKHQGLAAVSVSQIAEAAEAFPSQVTYYFRTKEALFVEAACREILYAGQQAERAAAAASSKDAYTEALVSSVVPSPGLALFIEALVLARRRQDLAPFIERTFDRLHAEGDRAYGAVRDLRGWPHDDDPALRARRFWALALGSVLRGAATGASSQDCARDMLELLRSEDEQTNTQPAMPTGGRVSPQLALVAGRKEAAPMAKSAGKNASRTTLRRSRP